MSKQTDAKISQGYVAKALPQTCMHCAHFKSDRVCTNAEYVTEFNKPYYEDKNMRCGIGGFAVKKMGTCNEWALASYAAR